jgi:hypothetical protein
MAEHWIEAREAARIVTDSDALRQRVAFGMVRCCARRATIDGEPVDFDSLPDEFWSDDGRERLQQNWELGDFQSSFDGLTVSCAFGVRFDASDVLAMVPVEKRALAARSLSVAGNAAWVSAREARRFAYDNAGLNPMTAGKAVVEQCRLGFVTARAVEMRWGSGHKPDDWTEEAREWDVPTWFWERFTTEDASAQDWEQGRFAGRGRGPRGYGWLTLNGVHFLRSSLDVLLPSAPLAPGADDQPDPRKPALSEAELQRWWNKLASARDGLTQEQLRVLAANDHPHHTVSRDRIRALAEGRKPGPKTI